MKIDRLAYLAAGYGGAFVVAAMSAACTTPGAAKEPPSLAAQFQTHCKRLKMPLEAEIRGESGLVRVAFQLAPDGTVANARVSHPSGFALLDQAVLDNVRACRFEPPTDNATKSQTESEVPVRFAFDVHTWFPLEGTAETAYLERFVAETNQHCKERVATLAERLQSEESNWHVRNDAITRLVLDYKQQYYGDIRQYAANDDPENAIKKIESYLQSAVTIAASNSHASFESLSAPQQQAYCQRYADRLSSGALDLMSVAIQFPELEFFIRKRMPAPAAP